MNREIKFRVWEYKTKLFYYWGFCELGFKSIPLSQSMTTDYVKSNSEQYTGIKDKNGKEIFEGDILVSGYGNLIVKYGEFQINVNEGQFNIKERKFGWFFQDEYGGTGPLFITTYSEWKYEIIGNIHENEDLLK